MRVIITAGGTGGHIYPALSIVKKIRKEDESAEILYVGTTDRMENKIIPNEGIPYFGIEIKGIHRSLTMENFKTLLLFLKAVKIMKRKIKEFKPDIVIGVGGYVSAPVLYAAHKLHIKTIIHEQNSMLGMTNKFLSNFSDAVLLSFPDTIVKNKNVIYTGNPSGELDKTLKFDKSEYKLSNNKKLVLIVMGSLGSQTITNKLMNILPKFNNKDYEVIVVTGENYYDSFKKLKLNKNVVIVPFINNLKRTFNKVDVLVSRAGATTISEIISYKVPTILVPSPYVTDNHQYKNADSLVKKDAAVMLEEKDFEEELVNKIDSLVNDDKKMKNIKNALSFLEVRDSTNKIYEVIKETVNEK